MNDHLKNTYGGNWKLIKECGRQYWVSDKGAVYTGKKNRLLKQRTDFRGNLSVTLRENNRIKIAFVSRLVLINFKGTDEDKKIVRHIDGNKLNNNLDNLKWVMWRGVEGLGNSAGTNNGMAKLTEKEVEEIRKLKNIVPCTKIAENYAVKSDAIRHIMNGRTWAHLDGLSKDSLRAGAAFGEKNVNAKLNNELVRYIREQYPKKDCNELALKLGVKYNTVKRVIEGKTWGHVR